MKARALICDERQNFSIEDVVLKDPAADQIMIRTCFTGVSIGTEFALIRNKISWGPYPICTGYMGTGIVEEIGAKIKNFKKGDKVYFRGNDCIELKGGKKVSPVSGAHASHSVIRPNTTHGAYHMYPGADMETSSMFVMPAVGLFGVDMSNPRMGETVVVYGTGLIGLGVVAACAHRGCVVVAVDINPKQLDLAKEFGADHLIDSSKKDAEKELKKIAPDGADAVFECTGIPACINDSIKLCRTYGTFVWQGNYGSSPVPFNFLPPHQKRLKMFFPCDDGWQPCRRAVLKNMAMGALKWEKAITHRIGFPEMPAVYDKINKGAKDIVGLVVKWS